MTRPIPRTAALATLAAALAALPLHALALCTSDGQPQPAALLERFISADCEACWRDAATPDAAPGTLALDWVVPSDKGDDAPLGTVASSDATDRLKALRRPLPARADAVTSLRRGPEVALRAALGEPFNDYIGGSIEIGKPGRSGWNAWLVLVETLPAGTEGSPVARNLVRNVFRPDWAGPLPPGARTRSDFRAMQIHEGAKASRLALVALLHDGRGRLTGAVKTECTEPR